MEYCASMKTIEVLIHGTKRKKLENIMLNERNQTEKTMYFYDSIYMKYPEELNPYRHKGH